MDKNSTTPIAKFADARRAKAKTARAPGRPGVAGRRRARRLSGRRLSRSARARHRAGLDHWHLDRRDQREPDRRQSGAERLERLKEFWTRMAYRPPFGVPRLDRIAGHASPTGIRYFAAFRLSSSPTPARSSERTFRSASTARAFTPPRRWKRRCASSSTSRWSTAAGRD